MSNCKWPKFIHFYCYVFDRPCYYVSQDHLVLHSKVRRLLQRRLTQPWTLLRRPLFLHPRDRPFLLSHPLRTTQPKTNSRHHCAMCLDLNSLRNFRAREQLVETVDPIRNRFLARRLKCSRCQFQESQPQFLENQLPFQGNRSLPVRLGFENEDGTVNENPCVLGRYMQIGRFS
jgi:hypothetical protein